MRASVRLAWIAVAGGVRSETWFMMMVSVVWQKFCDVLKVHYQQLDEHLI